MSALRNCGECTEAEAYNAVHGSAHTQTWLCRFYRRGTCDGVVAMSVLCHSARWFPDNCQFSITLWSSQDVRDSASTSRSVQWRPIGESSANLISVRAAGRDRHRKFLYNFSQDSYHLNCTSGLCRGISATQRAPAQCGMSSVKKSSSRSHLKESAEEDFENTASVT